MTRAILARRSRAANWKDLLPVALLLTPAVAILRRSLELGPSCAALGGPLDVRFVNYVLEWGYLHLHGLAVPDGSLWSPPFFFPVPRVLAYSENLMAGYLFYFPLRWFGLGPSAAVFVFHLLNRALTPIVAYGCLRTLRRGRWSAFVGAAVFSWGWVRYFHYGHIQFSAGYPIPLFLTAMYFAIHQRRPWALVVAAFTFLFTGYFSLYTAVFLVFAALALAGVWLVLPGGLHEMMATARFYGRYARMRPGRAIAIFLLCVGAGGLLVPSTVAYVGVQEAGLKTDSEAQLRLYWGDLYSWVRPPHGHRFLGDFRALFPRQTGGVWEKNAFIGWTGLVALLLPGIGLLLMLLKGRKAYAHWPRSLVAVSGAGTALILFFSSYGGSWAEVPFLLVHRHLPGLAGMRAPTRIVFVVSWFAVLALACLLDRLLRRCSLGKWLALGLGLLVLAENLAPLPRIVDRCKDEAVWRETERHLCSRLPRDEIDTLLFLPMDIHSIHRIIQQSLAMQLSQRCDLKLVNGYSTRRPKLLEPLLGSPARVFPCQAVREVIDRVHRVSRKAVLIHFDQGPPLGPAGYSASTVRDCLQSCLAPAPDWYDGQPGRPATALVTDAGSSCRSP